jgi:hypothetical protein
LAVTLRPLEVRTNVVPSAYRGVSVCHVDVALDEATLRRHLLGREAYRRTRFLVVRGEAGATALLRVVKESDQPLFSPIVEMERLAGPADCTYVVDPHADTAVPSTLARVATERAPGTGAVVIEGRYRHVSFIVNPVPLRIVVQEVVPPEPAKLLDQVQRLLAVAEDLPPMLPVPDTITFEELAARAPASSYLLPCNGSGVALASAATAYLDQRPPHGAWTLLGCARSREIHEWFYGVVPANVEMCPRMRGHAAGPVLTKCCLLEDRVTQEDGRVVVPWGASLNQVREALRALAQFWEPQWRPV